MNREERAAYQREYRKRSKQGVNNGDDLRAASKQFTESLAKVEDPFTLLRKLEAIEERVKLLEETVAKLAASQARVSVVPGNVVKPRAKPEFIVPSPYSKAAQASLRAMPYANRENGD